MPYQIKLERDFCIGAGECVEIAPQVFMLDDETKVTLVEGADPSGVDDGTIKEAAQACPVAAIWLLDENGKTIFPYHE